MKRFLVFAGHDYYPNGGWADFKEGFDDLDSAAAEAGRLVTEQDPNRAKGQGRFDWSQVIDLQMGTGRRIHRASDGTVTQGPIWLPSEEDDE